MKLYCLSQYEKSTAYQDFSMILYCLITALASLHELSRDNPKWEEWKLKGQVLLNQKKED